LVENPFTKFTISFKNNSDFDIKWKGEYTVKDEYGNILIHRTTPTTTVGSNRKQLYEPTLLSPEDILTSGAPRSLGYKLDYYYVSHYDHRKEVGYVLTTDLGILGPTLKTIELSKVE